MSDRIQSRPSFRRRNRRQDKRQRMLRKMANMRAAKARKRAETPPDHEPKMERWYPLELGVRDKHTGETAWIDLRSVRDASRRLSVVLKYCSYNSDI